MGITLSKGYLICDKCQGYYELQEGESPSDFESCQCGGRLKYSQVHPGKAKKDKNPYIHGSDIETGKKIVDVAGEVNPQEANHLLERIKDTDQSSKLSNYTGEISHFNNGKITFRYPKDWSMKTIVTDEKF
jgi:hypothetical protein